MGPLTLVATKLAAPVPPSPFLIRERLHHVLDGALQVPLTLVVGPAGSGKSVLVAGWSRSRTDHIERVWVNADGEDTPDRLFRHISRPLTDRDDRRAADPRGAVLERLWRGGRSGPLVLVIDDLHLVRSRHVTDELAALLDEIPRHVHVILVSRVDPPFVPGWRTSGRPFVEIRNRDLRLTDTEVAAMVATHPRVSLDRRALDDLTGKVDGWAAGLQLALASLTRSDDPGRTVARFGGATPAVADYLVDEVLHQLTAVQRAFLLDVAVLDDLSAEACRQLTGRDDAPAVLAEMADDNLLIERYTDDSYRYHPLLQQLLQLHLRLTDEPRFRRLHRMASSDAEARGHLVSAVEHLLDAEEFSAAVALCGRHRDHLVKGDGAALLPRWLARIPPHAFDDPDDQLGAAELMLDAGDILGCAFRLERCHHALPSTAPTRSHARIARLRSHCHHRLGDPEAALRSSREAQALQDGGASPDATVAIPRGFGLFWLGHLDEARSAVTGRVSDGATGSASQDPVALGLAARIELASGDLPACRDLVCRALAAADERGFDTAHPSRLHARLAQAQLLVESVADLDADDAVQALLDGAEAHGARDHTVVGLILQARLRWTSTCVAAGIGALAPASRLDLDRPLSPALRAELDRAETRLRLESGDRAEAARVLDRIPPGPSEIVLRSRLMAASGAIAPALEALDTVAEGPSWGAFEGLLARTRILADADDSRAPAAARRMLAHPLAPHVRRTYLEEGPRFRVVLGRLGGPGAAIATELDRAHERTATTSLSGRELAVLQFLPTRLTNQEIGSQIFVSPNTVKTHLKSLYRRLGVGSRDEAVRRARQLGLLPPDRTTYPAAGSLRPGFGAGPDDVGLESHERQAHVADAGDHGINVGDDALQGSGPR